MNKTFKCIICNKQYDPDKSRADIRGFCSIKCEHELEKQCGIKPPFKYNREKYRIFYDKARKLRQTIIGADPYPLK